MACQLQQGEWTTAKLKRTQSCWEKVNMVIMGNDSLSYSRCISIVYNTGSNLIRMARMATLSFRPRLRCVHHGIIDSRVFFTYGVQGTVNGKYSSVDVRTLSSMASRDVHVSLGSRIR